MIQRSISNASDSSDGSCRWELYRQEGGPAEVSAVFNAYSFNIAHATPGFIALGGPSTVGSNVRDWLGGKPNKLETFVQVAVNNFYFSEPSQTEFGTLRLQPPIASKAQLEYRVECFIELLSPS